MRLRRSGLTLLEVIVSFWILLMVLVMAAAVLHRTLRHTSEQEHTTRAAFLAQQRMEELMLEPPRELVDGEGSFEDPFVAYRWSVTVRPFEDEQGNPFLRLEVVVTGPAGSSYALRTHRRGWSDVLWFASNANEARKSRLYQVAEDGQDLREMSPHKDCNDSQPTLSPDGRYVAFVCDRKGRPQIYQMATSGKEPPELLVEAERMAHEPAWSPDGKHLAYATYEGGFSQVFVLNFKTGKTWNVSRSTRHEGKPAWSPEGTRLAVVATDTPGGGSRIDLVDLKGRSRRTVTDAPGWNTAPNFSPDGSPIVFMSSRDGNPDIYVASLGGRARRLTRDARYDTAPVFSPRGNRIAFWSARRGSPELFVINEDGSGLRPVMTRNEPLERGLFEKSPCWMPSTPMTGQ